MFFKKSLILTQFSRTFADSHNQSKNGLTFCPEISGPPVMSFCIENFLCYQMKNIYYRMILFIDIKFLEDEGAAKVGVVETTRIIQSYSHPSYPNLVFYDLPGVFYNFFHLHLLLHL